MAAVLPSNGIGGGGILGRFAERRPRFAQGLKNNSNALTQFGLGLLSGSTRSEGWANAAQGLAYGQQADQAARDRTKAEEEQAAQDEAVNNLLMSKEFQSLPAEYRTLLQNDRELARSFLASDLTRRTTPAAAPDPTDDMREYEFAKSQGFTGSFQEWQMLRPPTTQITNNLGPNGVQYPTPPFGMDYQRDPQGAIQLDANNQPTIIRVPGGEQAAAAAADTAAAGQRQANTDRQTGVIVTNIDQALALADQPMTTGVDGALAANIPGTPAYDLRAKVDTIKANIGFATLQEMRNSSPTGAALGSITERELAFLQATWANLDPNQSHDAFVQQLNAARQITMDIVEGRRTVGEDGAVADRAAPAAAAAGGDYQEGEVLTNPQTGERIILRNGQWVPL